MEYTFYPGKVVNGTEAYLIGVISSTAHLEEGCSADAAVLVDTEFTGSCRN